MPASGVVNWHIGRCGSSVLGSLLAQHSQLFYSNEIYSYLMPRRRGNQVLPKIDQVLDASRAEVSAQWHLIEIKHLADQNLGLYPKLQPSDWLELLMSRGYHHHLLMRRRNGLRRIVSHLRAARTGQYVRSASSAQQDSVAVEINIHSIQHGFARRPLLDWLALYEHGHSQMLGLLQAQHLSYLELTYEDHIEHGPKHGYHLVCDFLGIEAEDVTVDLCRINRGSLPELISNFDAVRDCLQPTRFAWMLDA